MDALQYALGVLPSRISAAVSRYSRFERIHEIRLREDLPISVTVRGKNHLLDESGRSCGLVHALRATTEEIHRTVSALCDGSLYRHMDTISRGFLVSECGVRAALSGRRIKDERGQVRTSLSDFCGVNLRIPGLVVDAADSLVEYYREHRFASTLVYSPPGEGKTTLLRALALKLSRGEVDRFRRVAVIDERGELFPKKSEFLTKAGLIDVLRGYEKAEGIECATRLFSPEVIICDELGEEDEAHKLLSNQHSGVFFVASAHANSVQDLYAKPRLKNLLEGGLFEILCRVSWDNLQKRTVTTVSRVPS